MRFTIPISLKITQERQKGKGSERKRNKTSNSLLFLYCGLEREETHRQTRPQSGMALTIVLIIARLTRTMTRQINHLLLLISYSLYTQ